MATSQSPKNVIHRYPTINWLIMCRVSSSRWYIFECRHHPTKAADPYHRQYNHTLPSSWSILGVYRNCNWVIMGSRLHSRRNVDWDTSAPCLHQYVDQDVCCSSDSIFLIIGQEPLLTATVFRITAQEDESHHQPKTQNDCNDDDDDRHGTHSR